MFKKMKLLEFKNRIENDIYSEKSILVIGFHSDIDYKKPNGFYVVLNSPFKRNTKYTSPINFETLVGVCKNKYLLMIRKNTAGHIKTTISKAVVPVK